jgi:hypothetical protein
VIVKEGLICSVYIFNSSLCSSSLHCVTVGLQGYTWVDKIPCSNQSPPTGIKYVFLWRWGGAAPVSTEDESSAGAEIKGQCQGLLLQVFHESSSPKLLKIKFRIFCRKFTVIFESQGAPPISMTPVVNFATARYHWCR